MARRDAALGTPTTSTKPKRQIEKTAIEQAMVVGRLHAEMTLNAIGDAVLSIDLSGNVNYLNLAAERMSGWGRDEALGQPVAEVFPLIDCGTGTAAINPMTMALQLGHAISQTPNCLLVSRDGREIAIEDSTAPIHDEYERIVGAVMVLRDVSQARAISNQATYLAQHDFLTGFGFLEL